MVANVGTKRYCSHPVPNVKSNISFSGDNFWILACAIQDSARTLP
jgi:hypothetical protein